MKRIWGLIVALSGVIAILFWLISPIYINYGKTNTGSIRLYGAHFNDSINNIALVKSLKLSLPPENFNFSGENMASYHYFINLIMAKTSQLFRVDDFAIYFKIAPLFLLASLSVSIWVLAKKLSGSNFAGTMAVLFVMVSGNLYYLSKFFFSNSSGKPAVAWIDEFSSKLVNYQYLSSLLIMFILFYILSAHKKFTLKIEILMAIAASLLFGFKFYAGVLFLSSMVFVKKFRKIFFLSIIPSLLVLFFLNGKGNAVFPFEIKPLWIIKTMFESPDRLNHPIWELARQTLLSTKSYFGILKLYFIGVLMYLVVNFGPRLITLFKRSENEVESLIKTISVLGVLIPMVFIQRGSAVWNIVQFSYYSVACTGFLLALRINKFRDGVKSSIFFLVWITMLPGVIYTSNDYANPPYTSIFSRQFVQAAEYLVTLPQGPVLIHPQYASNAIVSAISGHPAYLGDLWMLNSYGIDSSFRNKESNNYFKSTGGNLPDSVKYIFMPSLVKPDNANISNIYNNSEISIYSKKQ